MISAVSQWSEMVLAASLRAGCPSSEALGVRVSRDPDGACRESCAPCGGVVSERA